MKDLKHQAPPEEIPLNPPPQNLSSNEIHKTLGLDTPFSSGSKTEQIIAIPDDHDHIIKLLAECLYQQNEIKKILLEEVQWKTEAEFQKSSRLIQEQYVSELKHSYSWRITAPLRRLFEIWQVTKLKLRTIPSFKGRVDRFQPIDSSTDSREREIIVKKPAWLKFLQESSNITIITSAFPYDADINQRPIHLTDYMLHNGRKIIYIHWEWSWNKPGHDSRAVNSNGNLWDVPLGEFLYWSDKLYEGFNQENEYILTFPAPQLVDLFIILRKQKYFIIYDIMDDWEEFFRVGQAPWYTSAYERRAILEADLVTCVAPPLQAKFAAIRTDIKLIPNGYSQKIIDKWALNNLPHYEDSKSKIVGYFGHMVDSWFDWNLIIESARMMSDVTFELVGSGAPDYVKDKILDVRNIIIIDQVPPTELASIAKRWKVSIIPFIPSNLAKAVDPLKIYEYLLLGLPCVVTGIEHLANYPGVDVAKNMEDFRLLIHKRLIEGIKSEEEQKVKLWLPSCEWNSRLQTLREQIAKNSGLKRFYE
jgi:hypothetical protein